MSTKRKQRKSRDPDFSDVAPAASAKQAIKNAPMIREKEAAVLQATLGGAGPKDAVAAAGMQMKTTAARKYVQNVKDKYTDANGQLLVALENVGVSLGTLAEKIRDGLQAETTVKSGKDVVTVQDYKTQHKFLETALDVMGGRAPTKSVVETVKTHEQTVAIVQGISKSEQVRAILRQRLEQREVVEVSTVQQVETSHD